MAGLFPFHEWGSAAYVLCLIAGGAIIGLLAHVLLRRWPADPLLAVLGFVLGLLCIDVLVGAPLQLNTVFGYTPTVAGRFAGLGNLAFAQLAAAATILAGLIASRVGVARGIVLALGLIGVVLVIDALTVLGLRRRRGADPGPDHGRGRRRAARHPDPAADGHRSSGSARSRCS